MYAVAFEEDFRSSRHALQASLTSVLVLALAAGFVHQYMAHLDGSSKHFAIAINAEVGS